MQEPIVVRLDQQQKVSFGPDAYYQLIIGDDDGSTPIRTGIQTSEPGYVAPALDLDHEDFEVYDDRPARPHLRPTGTSH